MIAQVWRTRMLTDLPAAEYHAMKALSASGAWLLAEDCPAKFLWRSPWNPLWQGEDKGEFDLGTAAHLAVLEPEVFAARTQLVDALDYRTSRARQLRDQARAEGKVPLLIWQHDIVRAIAGSIRAHPIAASAFIGGLPEVTLTWRDAATGVPCKARVDWLPQDHHWLIDLKSAPSANPRVWRDQAYRLGYHARAAWYLDGAATVTGRRPEEYWFVVVEKEPPYLVSVIAMDKAAVEWGRLINHRACELFRRAAECGEWCGYRASGVDHDRAFRVGLPPWAIYHLQDRAEGGEFAIIESRDTARLNGQAVPAEY